MKNSGGKWSKEKVRQVTPKARSKTETHWSKTEVMLLTSHHENSNQWKHRDFALCSIFCSQIWNVWTLKCLCSLMKRGPAIRHSKPQQTARSQNLPAEINETRTGSLPLDAGPLLIKELHSQWDWTFNSHLLEITGGALFFVCLVLKSGRLFPGKPSLPASLCDILQTREYRSLRETNCITCEIHFPPSISLSLFASWRQRFRWACSPLYAQCVA